MADINVSLDKGLAFTQTKLAHKRQRGLQPLVIGIAEGDKAEAIGVGAELLLRVEELHQAPHLTRGGFDHGFGDRNLPQSTLEFRQAARHGDFAKDGWNQPAVDIEAYFFLIGNAN